MRRIGSLYSGIAGLELGLLAAFVEAGIPARIAWQCEIDPFCSRVLAHHFPDVQRFSDVATVSHPPDVDVLCGGFACQDVSSAGRGAGLGVETRSGFTLFHLLRIIDEIRPRWLVVENVASGAKRWLPRVVQELGDRGYRPRAVPLGAVDVGAPHRRLRVFVVAHLEREGLEVVGEQQARGQQSAAERGGGSGGEAVAHGHGHGREGERRGGILDGERAALGDDADGRRGEASGALPDAQCRELRNESGRLSGSRGAGEGEPGNDGAERADASTERRHEGAADAGRGCGGSGARSEERTGPLRAGGRTPQPCLGLDAHGLPFDVAGHAFPAARGQAQHAWEEPRALPPDVKVPDRPAKLRTTGNAVVPQCGLVVGRILVALGA